MMQLANLPIKLMGHVALLVLLIALGAISPATAFDFSGQGQAKFCATLDERTKRVDTELKAAQGGVHQSWQQQTERLRVMHDELQSSRTHLNTTVDTQRARNLSELRRATDSAGGRLAIDTYKDAQIRAEMSRRTIVGQADGSYTTAVQRLVADAQATQAGQIEALRIALNDALQSASGQCAAGVEPAAVSQQFSASVHTSRDTYLAQRKKDGIISARVSSLSDARHRTIASANQIYADTMNQARQALQAGLHSSR